MLDIIDIYKNKLYTSFTYILNNQNVDIIDYKYGLGLLFKSIYLISDTLIDDIQIIFKNLTNIEIDIENPVIKILDIEYPETYLYIFSKVKKDIEDNKIISDNTKMEMMIMLNKIADKRYPFIVLDEKMKELYKL